MHAALFPYLAKWHLALDGEPFETHSSQLAYVTRGAARAVLKILNPESDEHQGAAILMRWGGPAACVLEHDEQALLIERALPGTTLAEMFVAGQDDDATHIWCDVVQQLHTKPAPEGWPDVVERGRSFHRNVQHPLLPPDLVAEARAEYFALCDTQSPERFLLHADLNHFNIIRDETRGWVVIDPKGFAGELEWESGTFLRNPIPHWDTLAEPARLERRVRTLCDRLGFDGTRILRWCAAQTVLSCIWSVEDHGGEADLLGEMRIHETAKLLLG
ncbi:MAG TPA: aminoglycoside phosphotransferase family protein [Rhizomicrobium sp.]|jgi:streptomycin 6-kinase